MVEPACQCRYRRRRSFSPWVRKIDPLGEEMANLLQYSCLNNPMVAGAWLPTVQGVAKETDMT